MWAAFSIFHPDLIKTAAMSGKQIITSEASDLVCDYLTNTTGPPSTVNHTYDIREEGCVMADAGSVFKEYDLVDMCSIEVDVQSGFDLMLRSLNPVFGMKRYIINQVETYSTGMCLNMRHEVILDGRIATVSFRFHKTRFRELSISFWLAVR